MIETATARRCAGDWAGACAAAGIDVDFNLRSAARAHGQELAAQVRADLRHLAPDLLRWHMPRVAPDGLLRPGLTITLARYDTAGRGGARPVHLVARTPPAWADAGQRISLALWDESRSEADVFRPPYPHPRPSRRFRLDLHRHLWDARRTDELRIRSGADRPPGDDPPVINPDLAVLLPQGHGCAVDRWAAEAGILLHAEGRPAGTVTVRCGGARQRLALDVVADGDGRRDGDGLGPSAWRIAAASTDGGACALPLLPDAATRVLPDLELIHTGSIEVDRLHPWWSSPRPPSPRFASRTGRFRPRSNGSPARLPCPGGRTRRQARQRRGHRGR